MSANLPQEILTTLLDEYQDIKQHFLLKKFRPGELHAARFSECILRLIEFLDTGKYTSLGNHLDAKKIISDVERNTKLPESIRLLIPRLTRVLLDIRHKRDVAHVGGEVDPNYSDSLLVLQCADWILIELIRNYHTCSINKARQIVESINETKISLVAEVDGFIRVQNPELTVGEKFLVTLYHKHPKKIRETDLEKWITHMDYVAVVKFPSFMQNLYSEALIHRQDEKCVILPRGIAYVEKNINLELIV